MDQSWPKKPAGTVDWDFVFEDETYGLLPLIAEAQTPKALRQSALLIIEKLYTRKEDPAEADRFCKEITDLIPDDLPTGNLPDIITAVTALLRQIKEYRITKAAEFEGKLASSETGEAPPTGNRRETDKPIRKAIPKAGSKKSNRAYVYGGLAAGVAVIGIAVFHFSGGDAAPVKADPVQVLIQQIKDAATEEKNPKEHVFGGALQIGTNAGKTTVTATSVPQEACADVAWGLVNRGTVIINGRYSRKISPKIIRVLCSQQGANATIMYVPKK